MVLYPISIKGFYKLVWVDYSALYPNQIFATIYNLYFIKVYKLIVTK